MGKPKKTDILSEFERVSKPDIPLFAELTNQAKGDRSVTEFAECCGVNASTMSRIINGRFSSPVSDELVVAIAANADPRSRVSFEALLEAHGLKMPKKTRELVDDLQEMLNEKVANLGVTIDTDGRKSFLGKGESMLEQNAREIIQNDLLEKGFKVSVEQEVDVLDGPVFSYTADFAIDTDALNADGLEKWIFEVKLGSRIEVIRTLDRFFGCFYFDSPAAKKMKFTLAVFDKPSFYRVKDALEDREIPDCFSIMLLDARNRSVQYEYIVDRLGHPNQVKLYPDGAAIDEQEIYGVPDDE